MYIIHGNTDIVTGNLGALGNVTCVLHISFFMRHVAISFHDYGAFIGFLAFEQVFLTVKKQRSTLIFSTNNLTKYSCMYFRLFLSIFSEVT